jgi:hypothetical protein
MVFAGKKLFLYYSHYLPYRKRDKSLPIQKVQETRIVNNFSRFVGTGEDSLLFREIARGSTNDDCHILLQFNCTTHISLNTGGGVGDGGEEGLGGKYAPWG